jgi:prepilin-type N-terminal cleavage/methylation domain-containing protein
MRKVNSIYKQFSNKKKAFTLIELLIVIAIIGILFIVLVSKVDFATDKAKATGVQTDFRAFQVALNTVAQENAGFNTFGWDTGDENGDGIRNSYDKGDNGAGGGIAQNGIQDGSEVFVGSKVYGETWDGVWTLVKPGTTGLDANAVFALESAINKNLDPKLHITIASDGTIAMANQARDPWKNEYHGVYISQAERDHGADRGAIIIYPNGANGKWGSAHDITNGVVSIWVPGNNIDGKDDMSITSCYSYFNGFGEVVNSTFGFSNNIITNGPSVNGDSNGDVDGGNASLPDENPSATNLNGYTWMEIKALAQAKLSKEDYKNKYGIEPGSTKTDNGITYVLVDLGLEAGDYDGFVFMYQATKSRMNDVSTNLTGYPNATLVIDYLSGVETSLTGSDLGKAMKSVDVTCSHAYDYREDSYPTSIHNAKMFLPSIKELGVGNITFASSHEQEGQTFDLFVDGVSSRLAFQDLIGITLPWWTRSSANSIAFYLINNSSATSQPASGISAELTVVPCFVVG